MNVSTLGTIYLLKQLTFPHWESLSAAYKERERERDRERELYLQKQAHMATAHLRSCLCNTIQ